MPYGHPAPRGHGRRIPAYRWSPSALPPSRRRKRRPAHAARPAAQPDFAGAGALFRKAAAAVARGCLGMLLDSLVSGKRCPDSMVRVLGCLGLVSAMASSPACLAIGLFALLPQFLAGAESYALAESADGEEGGPSRLCIRRTRSANGPPAPEALRRAWEAARGTLAGKLLAGTLLSDLEPSVDQSYVRAEDGTIVGRRPGIKGWLRGNCPDMVSHYKALMGYKALADKLRVALGIEEPDALDGVLDFGGVAVGGEAADGGSGKDFGGMGGSGAGRAPGAARGRLEFRRVFRLRKTDAKAVEEGLRSLFGERMAEAGVDAKDFGGVGGLSMAALDEIVRVRLGRCWMRRIG